MSKVAHVADFDFFFFALTYRNRRAVHQNEIVLFHGFDVIHVDNDSVVTFQKSFVGEQNFGEVDIFVGGDESFSVSKVNAEPVPIIDVDVENISQRHGKICPVGGHNQFRNFGVDFAENVLKSFGELLRVANKRLDEISDREDAIAVENEIVVARQKNDIGVVVAACADNLGNLHSVNLVHANIENNQLKKSGLEHVEKFFGRRKSSYADFGFKRRPIFAEIFLDVIFGGIQLDSFVVDNRNIHKKTSFAVVLNIKTQNEKFFRITFALRGITFVYGKFLNLRK